MRRRQFIGLIGGAAAWSRSARAQQPERVRHIGMINTLGSDDPETQARIAVFEQALEELGWVIGRNLKIEIRQIEGDIDHGHRDAAELVALAPEVIVTIGSVAIAPLQQATRTIPLVFVNAPDPVGAGFVRSMAQPGGNITGFSNFEYSMSGKWADLLKQIAPNVTRALVVRDPTSAAGIGQFAAVRSVAQNLGIEWRGRRPARPCSEPLWLLALAPGDSRKRRPEPQLHRLLFALTWRAQSEGLPASFVPTSRRSHCWASRWSRLHAPPFRAPPEDTPSMSCSRKASGDEHRDARVCSAGPSAGRVLRVISSV
jgi:hypothetical protein